MRIDTDKLMDLTFVYAITVWTSIALIVLLVDLFNVGVCS